MLHASTQNGIHIEPQSPAIGVGTSQGTSHIFEWRFVGDVGNPLGGCAAQDTRLVKKAESSQE